MGSIDSHTFDESLFRAVVAKLPEVSFVLAGPSSVGQSWTESNVRFLGQKDYQSVARAWRLRRPHHAERQRVDPCLQPRS